MKILLGLTGSVATTLNYKLINAFRTEGHEVKVVFTNKATQFMDELVECSGWYGDEDEYYKPGQYVKGGTITHIELRDWADAFVIAPCSANTMSKIRNGICDNLLTTIVRAWNTQNKPLYIAPAMNVDMFEAPQTYKQILALNNDYRIRTIWPTKSKLACGYVGIGAMADIGTIVNIVEGHRWTNVTLYDKILLDNLKYIGHPGLFGANRRYDIHTGIDLYGGAYCAVGPFEEGEVVHIGQFTGAAVGSPWWNDTYSVSVQGRSGIIVYGEIQPTSDLKVGDLGRCIYCLRLYS